MNQVQVRILMFGITQITTTQCMTIQLSINRYEVNYLIPFPIFHIRLTTNIHQAATVTISLLVTKAIRFNISGMYTDDVE